MRISRFQTPHTQFNSLNNQILTKVDQAKYLGVTLSNELCWSPHINNTISQAHSSLGFLRRNLRGCPEKLTETAYISLVRSVLEYAATIWDPHLSKDINT